MANYYHMKNLEGGMHSELILDFHVLISSLRDYINKFNFHDILERGDCPVQPLPLTEHYIKKQRRLQKYL